MGILIIPYLLFNLIIGIISLVKLIKLFRKRALKVIDFVYGLCISALIYCLICLFYLMSGSAWALSPPLVIPFFMIIIPFFAHIAAESSTNEKHVIFSKRLLISIIITTLISVISFDLVFDILDYLNVKKTY